MADGVHKHMQAIADRVASEQGGTTRDPNSTSQSKVPSQKSDGKDYTGCASGGGGDK